MHEAMYNENDMISSINDQNSMMNATSDIQNMVLNLSKEHDNNDSIIARETY